MSDKLYIPNISFFNSVKVPVTGPQTTSSFYNDNVQSEQILLEVSGVSSISLKVQGCIKYKDADGNMLDDADCIWNDLSLLDAKDYSLKNSITGNGLFIINISGIIRLRLKIESISGSATVVGTMR